MEIILASSSPRRKQLLDILQIGYTTISPNIDESVNTKETATDYVTRLAREKAEKVVVEINSRDTNEVKSDYIVVSGDTTVSLDNQIVTKAESTSQARQILLSLSGRHHKVISGLHVRNRWGQILSLTTSALIKFRKLTNTEITQYLKTANWQDKAGAYAIQGEASAFVEDIIGDKFAIIGLPIVELAWCLISNGIQIKTEILQILVKKPEQFHISS